MRAVELGAACRRRRISALAMRLLAIDTAVASLLGRRRRRRPPAGRSRIRDDRPRPCRAADGHDRRGDGRGRPRLRRSRPHRRHRRPGLLHRRARRHRRRPRAGAGHRRSGRRHRHARRPCRERPATLAGPVPVLAVLAAGRGEIYGQGFAADGAPLGAARGRPRRQIFAARASRADMLLAGSGADARRRSARPATPRRASSTATRRPTSRRSAGSALAAPPPVAAPRPLYLRPPDAKPQARAAVARR